LDDPHWSVISIANLDEFLDKSGKKLKMETTLVEDPKKDDDVEEEVQ